MKIQINSPIVSTMATLLDGNITAQKIKDTLKQKYAAHRHEGVPGLAAVLIGDNPASQVYVGHKEKAMKAVGFHSETHKLPATASEKEILALIEKLNAAPHIDGILVQLPLPESLSQAKILYTVSPKKDVDGFHPHNLGQLLAGKPSFIPCTPKGIVALLKDHGIKMSGKKAVVIGRSLIVGKPTALLLLQENATITLCHSKTRDLAAECRQADILVVAMGKPRFIKNSFVKEGAVVVDVGIHREQGKLIGDVDFDDVHHKASFITPVPGGVGPMTIAMLLENTWESFLRRV